MKEHEGTNKVTAQRRYFQATLDRWVSRRGGSGGSGTHLKDIPRLLALVASCWAVVAGFWLLVAGC